MRKKWLKILFAFAFAIFTLPFSGLTASAEEKVYDDVKDAKIIAKALHADEDKASGAAGFINEEAILNIENGEVTLTITIPNIDFAKITGLQVEGKDPKVIEGKDARNMVFSLNKLKPELIAQVQYDVPGMFEGDEPFRFVLEGLDNLPVKEENDNNDEDSTLPDEEDGKEQPNEDVTNPDEEESEENNDSDEEEVTNPVEDGNNDSDEETSQPEEETIKIADLADGFYLINTDYLYIDSDKPSAMGSYLDSPVFLSVKDGKGELTITINANETVTLLKVDGKKAIESKVEGNFRYETFGLSDLTSIINAYVEYQAPMPGGEIWNGEADFRIVLDEANVSESSASAKPGAHIKAPKPGKENPNPSTGEPSEKPIEKPKDVDNVSTINFVIKHETENKPSIADQFFKKPAVLIEKDGERYLQLTVTNPEYINWLKFEFGEMKIVKINEDGSAVYQVKLPKNFDLSRVALLDMMITVPGLYKESHTTRVIFDISSIKEIDLSNGTVGDPLDESELPKAKDIDTKLDSNTPPKPELGNGDDDDTTPGANGSNGAGLNPKTGEETNILFYVLLLIGSAIPLAIQAKKHFA